MKTPEVSSKELHTNGRLPHAMKRIRVADFAKGLSLQHAIDEDVVAAGRFC